MDLLSDRITMLPVKDYRWLDEARGEGRKYAGGRRHSVEFCPLADGNTPWPDVLAHLHEIDFAGPVSLHSEYQGKHSFADLTVDEVFEQTRQDFERFREWVAEVAEPASR
jgi:sugar phosphate isomerase/epimerase